MNQKIFKALFSILLISVSLSTYANETQQDTLRVCAAKDELPYSNVKRQGFENSIAEVIAKNMGRKLEYVWSDRAAIYIVNDYLNQDKCDLVMGVDENDPRVLTSNPYYRSSYVFVYRTDRNLNIDNWDSPDLKKLDKFAFIPSSPAEVMLRKINKYEQNFNYLMSLINFKSRRNSYVRYHPKKLIDEVVQGKADIAVLWGPEAARYVNSASVPLTMKVTKNEFSENLNGEKVGQYFSQSLAVKEGNKEFIDELNKALEKSKKEITNILKQEGVPLITHNKIAES